MTDPKALEELDLASRAIGRARALMARVDSKALEAARRIDDPKYPTDTAGFIADAVTVARALLAGEDLVAAPTAEEFDANVNRLKACEHIADGDEGWERLREICPSTSAVARLRDQFAVRDVTLREALAKVKLRALGTKYMVSSDIIAIVDAVLSSPPEGGKP